MMKKIIIFSFIFILFLPSYSYGKEKLRGIFFYSSHCKSCLDFKNKILPSIKEKYKNDLAWEEIEVSEDPKNLSLLHSAFDQSKKVDTASPSTPAVLIGDTILTGYQQIESKLEELIESSLAKRSILPVFSHKDLAELFKKFSVFAIMWSGLIDGINPCAFAVIIFFISFLAAYKYSRKEIIYVGASYCLAVFVTYLFIGLGFFKFLYSLSGFYLLTKSFYYLVACLSFLFAILALYDYFKLKKTQESQALILQLPQSLKKKIHVLIGSGLRNKKGAGVMVLVITAFIIGCFVSLLEAVCTGQVYLPTIVFVLKNTTLKIRALSYLVLYNLMFILPLLVIFLLFLLGVSYERFNNFLKRNLGKIKILMALVFLLLGGLILSLI